MIFLENIFICKEKVYEAELPLAFNVCVYCNVLNFVSKVEAAYCDPFEPG